MNIPLHRECLKNRERFHPLTWSLFALLSLPHAALAQAIKLPSIFREHMVLQRELAVPVWGQADAGAKITVSFAGQTKATQADAQGRWSVSLDPMPPSDVPQNLTVGSIVISDVLVGEVWLCSGQSNMRWIVGRRDKFPGVEHGEEEIAKPERPNLRIFSDDEEPVWEQRGWQRCGGEALARFSATAYFFGDLLQREMQVPVGVINISRGGTSVQAWTPRDFALRNPFTRHYVELEAKSRNIIQSYNNAQRDARIARQAGRKGVSQPPPLDTELEIARLFHVANLYDAHIEPIAPFAIRGVVWYQGEANASRLATALAYGSMLRDLIEGWRDRWKQPDMPWLVMQLPCWDGATSEPWPWVRQGQWEVARTLPNVGLATTCDVSDSTNLHPAQKREAGHRLAQLALARTYQIPIPAEGPTVMSLRRIDHRLIIGFDTSSAAIDSTRGPWNDVELAGADGEYHHATVRLDEDSATVSCEAVKKPVSIRYGWRPVFTPSLFNIVGLPMAPFEAHLNEDGSMNQGLRFPSVPIKKE